ncbi:hypothetical protein B0H14DRAFT_2648506 [Mycena olivaceomarginata]|nr:hypothetical protein B0H14DRAFT_2648506 [Mycena olivaceomarginata]
MPKLPRPAPSPPPPRQTAVTASSTNPPAVTTAAPPATIAASPTTAPTPAAHATTAPHLEPVAAAPTLAAAAHAGGAGSYAAAATAAPAAAVVPNMPLAPAAAVQRIANNAAAAPAGTAWRTQDGNPPPRLIRAHPVWRLPCFRILAHPPHPGNAGHPHAPVRRSPPPKCMGLSASQLETCSMSTRPASTSAPPPRHGCVDQPHHVIPYNMPVTGYVGTFGGFMLPNSQGGADAARNLLQAAMCMDREIAQFVQTHRNAFGPHISAEQAWNIFSNSIAIEGIELLVNNTTTVAWHLHATPPPMTTELGSNSGRCRICPSITHPTGLCPPCLPRWLGPTPTTIAALEDTSRQAATRAQDHIRGNTEAGSSAAPRAGANRGPGTATAAKKPRKDLGKTKKGGDPKGKGKCREHNNFF